MRLWTIAVAVLLLSILVLGGCAQPAPPAPASVPKSPVTAPSAPVPASPTAPSPAATRWPEDIAIGCKPAGSTTYVDAVTFAKMFSKYIKGVKAHGAVYSNATAFPGAIQSREIDMSGTGSTGLYDSVRGLGEWKGKPITCQRTIAIGEVCMYLPLPKTGSGIKSVADLKGKRCAFDQAGSASVKEAYEGMLKAYGLSPQQDVKILTWSSTDDMVSQIREGKADACAWWVYRQTTFCTDLTTSGDVYLLGLPADKIKAITELVRGSVLVTFPKGTYKGQDQDVSGFGQSQHMVVRDDLPDDLVYAMTAAIYDHFDEFVSFREGLVEFKLPGSLNPALCVLPFHNGAIKYFKEKGFWKAEHDAMQARLLTEIGVK